MPTCKHYKAGRPGYFLYNMYLLIVLGPDWLRQLQIAVARAFHPHIRSSAWVRMFKLVPNAPWTKSAHVVSV